MRKSMLSSSLLVMLACASASASCRTADQQPPVPLATLEMGPLACEVWARELGFASSVAKHDAAAFAQFVSDDAVFSLSSPEVTKGRDAIIQAWAGIIDGSELKLSWYPTRVVVNASGDLAWSTGPALLETPGGAKDARPKLTVFYTVWRRGADGVWRVAFDDGRRAVPATAAQVHAYHDARMLDCPHD